MNEEQERKTKCEAKASNAGSSKGEQTKALVVLEVILVVTPISDTLTRFKVSKVQRKVTSRKVIL